MQTGIVLKSLGQVYEVLIKSGKVVPCTLKGNMRTKDITTTNPVVVGDNVVLVDAMNNEYVISEVSPRKNYIIRKSKKLSKQFQIVAANIDRVFVFVTLTHPKTHNTFVDRILITAEAYGIEAHLIFNKVDLYKEKQKEELEERMETYTSIGYSCHVVSLKDSKNLTDLKRLFENKVSLVCGLSGTGKTTLINYLVPGLNHKTGEISKIHKSGMHITTFSEMIALPGGGFIIDTPGMQEFGLADISKYDLSQYFREMNEVRNKCKFNSCMHVNEPDCAVLKAVQEGEIAVSRYESYLSMLFNEGEEKSYE